MTVHMGHIETVDDLKSCTPSVFTRRVKFPADVKDERSLYFFPLYISVVEERGDFNASHTVGSTINLHSHNHANTPDYIKKHTYSLIELSTVVQLE